MLGRFTHDRRGISFPTICLVTAGCILAIYTVAAGLIRPTMNIDSAQGFIVLDSMRRGAPFNYSLGPSSVDISTDTMRFQSMWSPGQYFIPGIFESMGASLGLAIVLVVASFSALGLFGWYYLYRAFGFPYRTCAIAIVTITCMRYFAQPFEKYNGGEVLLFGVAPWFALLVWRLRSLRWTFTLPILVGLAALSFAKLTGVIFGGATIAGATLSSSRTMMERDTIRKAMVAGVIVSVFALLFFLTWLSRGATPASATVEFASSGLLTHTVASLTNAWMASLSIGDLAGRIFKSLGRPIVQYIDAFHYALFPVTIAGFIFVFRQLQGKYDDYIRFVLWLSAAYCVVMVYLNARGAGVGYLERHFRSVSLVLFIGIIHAFSNCSNRLVRVLFVLFVGGLALYGTALFAVRVKANLQHPVGSRGFRHAIASAPLLQFIKKIDVPTPGGMSPLVLVTSPEIRLEFRQARVIAIHAHFQSAAILQKQAYRGRVARIFVIIRSRLVANGKANIILRSFLDYPSAGWRKSEVGDFTVFSQ